MRQEATAINRNFSQQVLQGGGTKTMGFKEANPFVKPGDDAAAVAYRCESQYDPVETLLRYLWVAMTLLKPC
jgi:hypothetical protein